MNFRNEPTAQSHWFPAGERQLRLLLAIYDAGGSVEFKNRLLSAGIEFSFNTAKGLGHKGLVRYSWPFARSGQGDILCKVSLTPRGTAMAEYIRAFVSGQECRLFQAGESYKVVTLPPMEALA